MYTFLVKEKQIQELLLFIFSIFLLCDPHWGLFNKKGVKTDFCQKLTNEAKIKKSEK